MNRKVRYAAALAAIALVSTPFAELASAKSSQFGHDGPLHFVPGIGQKEHTNHVLGSRMRTGHLFRALDTSSLFASGRGTASDPYVIDTPTQLVNVSQDLTVDYILGQDIDMTGVAFPAIFGFSGVLDGNGHSISNLTVSPNQMSLPTGFFSNLTGTVKNLSFINESIASSTSYVGGIAGQTESGAQIDHCTVSGTISSGGSFVGGIVGFEDNGSIMDSISSTNVSGASRVGGIAGYSDQSATISQSSSSGTITASSDAAGGLVGSLGYTTPASINDSYSNATVSANGLAGGLVGEIASPTERPNGSEVIDSYSTGSVSGSQNIGGLDGLNVSGQVTDSYWDTDTSGVKNSPDGIGLTDVQLKSGTLPSGFSPSVWSASAGSYPTLISQSSGSMPTGQLPEVPYTGGLAMLLLGGGAALTARKRRNRKEPCGV